MKHITILRLFVFLFFSLLLSACSGRKTVIGVSQCCGGLWRDKVNKEISLGLCQYDDAKAIFASADDDGQKQVRQIDSMIAQKVDLLVVAPNDAQSVIPAVERAYRAGIPVVLYDRRLSTSQYTAYIGGDNVEAGRASARFLVAKLQGKGTVVEITGLQGNTPVSERHQGFMEVMKLHPSMKYISLKGNWSPQKAKSLILDLAAKGEQVDGVFCHNDCTAFGVVEAAQKLGLAKQMLIVGIDGLPGKGEGVDRVKKGDFSATYVYPTRGEKVVQLAMNILEGRPYKKDNYLQSFLATPENCIAIELQYQDLEAKVRDMDQISSHLNRYSVLARIQQWAIGGSIIIVLVLLLVIYFIYKKYRAKLQKQKVVANGLVGEKEGWAAELNQLDESERYFLDRFKKKVIERMGDANMKMDDLGAEMQLSKVQLYRKVKAMTGKTPAELLKEMRIQRAYTLLTQTDRTISEVSAEVGFATPGYFSSCFKKQYGMGPTDLRNGDEKNKLTENMAKTTD